MRGARRKNASTAVPPPPQTSPLGRRPLRRHLTGLLAASFLVGAFTAVPATAAPPSPADELPPQEPGVTLRVFDVQVPLDELCDIKAGQTPNVDKLMPRIDWDAPEDFGFEDRFVSQVTANIHVPEDGSYAFRLTSDDGSRLLIDDQLVIDHDGLHGAEPKDGSVT
ncbi:hypothetical protein DDE05_11680, partial [Streptomyces cavourensis]